MRLQFVADDQVVDTFYTMVITPAKPHLVIPVALRHRCGLRPNVHRAVRRLHGSPVDSVIRDAAALAHDDRPS